MKINQLIRRSLAVVTATLALPLALPVSASTTINFDSPAGYVAAQRKIQCSLQDEKESTFVWKGKAYSHVPGEPDKHLFNLLGMNVRQCATVKDEKYGAGYRLVSREIMLYLDPKTGKVIDSWNNPWTGKSVEIIHVANDPVNQPANFGYGRDGKPLSFTPEIINNTWFMNVEIPLFYTNPLAGNYQKYVGGTYHATEIFDFSGDIDELRDSNNDSVNANINWVRFSPWLPWMEMGSRVGMMYFNASGAKLNSWDELPLVMKQHINDNHPAYRHAPPISDQRRNETSWTHMKKIIDSRQ